MYFGYSVCKAGRRDSQKQKIEPLQLANLIMNTLEMQKMSNDYQQLVQTTKGTISELYKLSVKIANLLHKLNLEEC